MGHPRHAGPHAPRRRAREGRRHRQHRLHAGQSREDGPPPRRQDRRASPPTSRRRCNGDPDAEVSSSAGAPPGRRSTRRPAERRVGKKVASVAHHAPQSAAARSRRAYSEYRRCIVPELNMGQLRSSSGASTSSTPRRSRRCRACRSRPARSKPPSTRPSPPSPPKEHFMSTAQVAVTTKKDWTSDQEVRWCPGCGDYGILLAVQTLMPELGVAPENTVFISGIGCSSRFPYYMNTYGMHSIHGRAPAIATGRRGRPPGPRRVGHHRRRRRAVDRWKPPHPRAAPQREPQHPAVQQPDLRAHQGSVLADLTGRQGHQVDADGLHRSAVQPAASPSARRRASSPHARPRPQAHDRHVPLRPRASRRLVRRDLPELQRVQRRPVRRRDQEAGARRDDDQPRPR